MPTRRTMALVIVTVPMVHMVIGLAKLWAARVSTETGAASVVAKAVQVAG